MDPQMLIQTLTSMEEDQVVSIIGKILSNKPELAPSVVAFAVPDLTYAPARALAERRSKGVVKSFDKEKGCGFIACPELKAVFGSEVYVHSMQLGSLSTPGTEVNFSVLLNKENKPQAFDVQAIAGGGAKAPDVSAAAVNPMAAMGGMDPAALAGGLPALPGGLPALPPGMGIPGMDPNMMAMMMGMMGQGGMPGMPAVPAPV